MEQKRTEENRGTQMAEAVEMGLLREYDEREIAEEWQKWTKAELSEEDIDNVADLVEQSRWEASKGRMAILEVAEATRIVAEQRAEEEAEQRVEVEEEIEEGVYELDNGAYVEWSDMDGGYVDLWNGDRYEPQEYDSKGTIARLAMAKEK